MEKRIEKYGVADVGCEILDSNDANKEAQKAVLASPPSSTRCKVTSSKYICFVCNEVTSHDGNMYNDGGLGRCSQVSAKYTLEECSKEYLEQGIFVDY